MTTREMSIIEREMCTPEGRRELAAAQGIADAADLLLESFEASGLTQERLAQLLGITAGRVSQVLHGDGNVKVATLARFLSAMGRELRMDAPSPGAASRMEQPQPASSSAPAGAWSDLSWNPIPIVVMTGRRYPRAPVDSWEHQRHADIRTCLT